MFFFVGLVEKQNNRQYTTRLDDRPGTSSASRATGGRGGKPKAQKDHERALEATTKGYNDLKKTTERDSERKVIFSVSLF